MKRRTIQNDPIATAERDRGLVVPIRIFMNAVDPTTPESGGTVESEHGNPSRAARG